MKTNNRLSIHLYLFFLCFHLIVALNAYSAPIKHPVSVLQASSACITIHQVHLTGLQKIKEISSSQVDTWRKHIEGQCVDEQGLLDYADYVTSGLVNAGYLTSYVHYPEQTFLFGVLQAAIIVGTVSSVVYQDNKETRNKLLPHVFPFKLGDAFNLRQVEQGLYNLQNAALHPFHIKLIPDNTNRNAIQIRVIGPYRRELQGILSFGSYSMFNKMSHGVSHTFIVANPLLRSDFLYSELSRQFNDAERTEAQSATLFYSFPYQYWLFSVSGSYQNSKTVITSYDVSLPLQQHSWFLLLKAEYLLKRTENTTTSLNVGSEVQKSNTFLSGIDLRTQQRLASNIMGGLAHQVSFPSGNVFVSLVYKQRAHWFGANTQQVTGLNKPQVLQVSASIVSDTFPFQYQGQLDVQLSRDKLDALLNQESFVGCGGISGFMGGGEHFEMGSNSLKLQNELLWQSPWQQVALYTSLGLGATSNDSATFWKENVLLGSRFGMKGQLGRLSYDVFAETPIWQIDRFLLNSVSSGIQISFHY